MASAATLHFLRSRSAKSKTSFKVDGVSYSLKGTVIFSTDDEFAALAKAQTDDVKAKAKHDKTHLTRIGDPSSTFEVSGATVVDVIMGNVPDVPTTDDATPPVKDAGTFGTLGATEPRITPDAFKGNGKRKAPGAK